MKMKIKQARNWYKSATAWVGAAMVVMPQAADQLQIAEPYLGEHGVTLFSLVGALIIAARAIKQEGVSGGD